jgi:hypothetical protein
MIDLDGLKKEHLERCRSIEMAFAGPFPATDWNKVHEAIAEIESVV